MRPSPRLRLVVAFCLILELSACAVLLVSLTVSLADDPPPDDGLTQPQTPPLLTPPVPPDEKELRAGLAALEAARSEGPQAMVALFDTLRGRARDLAMDEIVEAQEQLARQAPSAPDTPPISEAKEWAALEAQRAHDEANRAQALAYHDDPALDQDQIPQVEYRVSSAYPLATDRTVGNGCTYATIGAAVAAAQPGDRLLLEGGRTFTENLSISISLTLQGGYAGCASGLSTPTTIDGNAAGRVMYIYENLDVTLENLSIVNGSTSGNGAGVFVRWNTLLRGTNLSIHSNTADALGGGVRLWGGSATFTNTYIYNNTALSGAGVYGEFYNGYTPVLSLPYYADLYDNRALSGAGLGGGVYMRQGTVFLTDCSDLYSNDAIQGGGAYLVTSTLTIRGECSEIESNTATGDGGGVYAQGSTVNLDDDAALHGNRAGHGGGAGSGGGAYLDNSSLWSDKAAIQYNTANSNGGGVYAANSSLLDMDLGSYGCAGPRCSRLARNTATSLYGGGVYVDDNSEANLQQTFVENNTAVLGGGIYVSQGRAYLYNDLVAGNDAIAGVGDGLRLYTGSTFTGIEDTLAYNPANGTGDAIGAFGAVSMSLAQSIVWGHSSGIPTGYNVTCSDVQGGYAGASNLAVDPLFVDPTNADFHLQGPSPVIDRCTGGFSVDMDDQHRPVLYVRPPTPYDMGADECFISVHLPAILKP